MDAEKKVILLWAAISTVVFLVGLYCKRKERIARQEEVYLGTKEQNNNETV